jgi:hypothetical protein
MIGVCGGGANVRDGHDSFVLLVFLVRHE